MGVEDLMKHKRDRANPRPTQLLSATQVPNTRLISIFHYTVSEFPVTLTFHTEIANATTICVAPKNISMFPFTDSGLLNIFAKRKYKPVALKVCPVIAGLPEQFRIVCDIHGDPLATLP